MHRRDFCLTLAAASSMASSPALAEPQLNESGLHVKPWFMDTFMNLRDDHAEVTAQGKHMVLMFEQKGCPYCAEMHKVNLEIPEISKFIQDNFGVLQINLWGSREVTDFDGKVMEERELAKRWRVHFTPTIVFLPTSLAGMDGKSGRDIEIARMPGYFKPFHFISFFEFIAGDHYKNDEFQRFLTEKFDRLTKAGKKPTLW